MTLSSPTAASLLCLHEEHHAFNMRNVCETLCLLAGEKPAMRLVMTARETDRAVNVLRGLGLAVAISEWCLETAYSTSLGDNYTKIAERTGGPDDLLVTMVAMDPTLATEALCCESDECFSPRLGELFGYPECCSMAYKSISASRDWLTAMLEQTPMQRGYPFGANRVSYLFYERSLFFDYFPCSFTCRETARIADTVVRCMKTHGLGSLTEAIRAEMMSPVLIRSGVVVSLCGAMFDGQFLHYRLDRSRLHGWQVQPSADECGVWDSDALIRQDGVLTFFKRGNVVDSVAEDMSVNRLLLFSDFGGN